MAIKRDLSDLPTPKQDEGLPPDANPRYGHLLAESLATAPEKPHARDTLFRYSDAAKCARYLSYKLAGTPREPFDLAGLHVMHLGTLLHEAWQDSLKAAHDEPVVIEASSEVEGLTSGSADAFLPADAQVLELKTVGGFKFKMAVGERGPAQGPSAPHMVQLGLNMRGLDATHGTLVYMATEAISKGIAERKNIDEASRFVAEWTFTAEQLAPDVDKELARLKVIAGLHDKGQKAPRHVPYEMPPGARIVDVDRSRWELTDAEGNVIDTGDIWSGQHCSYCPFQQVCREDD